MSTRAAPAFDCSRDLAMTVSGLNMFAQPDPGPPASATGLAAELHGIITHAAENHPRSLQLDLGPSEAGLECPRRLAYRMLGWDKPAGNVPSGPPGGDPWPATVGTAIHAWLAQAFSSLPGGRWLVETPLVIAPPLLPGGFCDLYDTATDTVIDWKTVGPASMRAYMTGGPRPQYVTQAHLYGLGWERAGRHPKTVALAFLPRGGYLSRMWVWDAPYDRGHALRALTRLAAIHKLVWTANPEARPERWALIPAVPSHGCAWCPWYRPGSADLARGCPGDLPPRDLKP